MTETDVIGHLLDVEQQAAEMLLDAQTEADRRIAEARNSADSRYKAEYEKLVAGLEEGFAQEAENVRKLHLSQMEEYRSAINGTKTDRASFDRLMDSLLFAG